jgi:hypothetical protein
MLARDGGNVALYEPDRHEPLASTAWDETRVCEAIAAIVDDAHNSYGGIEKLWPIHPIDVSPERADVLLPLYYGAAGAIWALQHLDAARRDYLPAVETLRERHRAATMRLSGRIQHGFALGEAGIDFLHWQLAPSNALLDRLQSAIEANAHDPSNGFSWGAPGTMRAALFLHARTGDARWADLFVRHADMLWDAWHWHEPTGSYLWTQDLYGNTAQQLGALHGFAGNAFVLLSGRHLLAPERQEALIARTRHTLAATALRENGSANWELCARPSDHPGMSALRVQHCTGAPGMVNTLCNLPPDPDADALLLAAGELTWAAGPLAKLPSLCHGAPGSGYAFLKLYTRTGDATWLDRARAFAMHAIAQNDRHVAQHGMRKYSLWTGDLGLAIYLRDCVDGTARIPLYDVF